MVKDPSPPSPKPSGRSIWRPSSQPADLATLVIRRRLAHLIAIAFLVIAIVALIAAPADPQAVNAGNVIGGLSLVLMVAAAVASIQYEVRIYRRRRRRTRPAPRVTAPKQQSIPTTSVAFQPIRQLRSAHQLLESVLPDIERFHPGIGATAEKTRRSLEQTGRRVLLQEEVLGNFADGINPADPLTAKALHTLETMITRLRAGVDQYVNLTQQATATAASLTDLNAGQDLQEAEDQLAGLSLGLREVQRIAGRKP